ncbi:unnamed protein product, partial [Pylaiella littoralis]
HPSRRSDVLEPLPARSHGGHRSDRGEPRQRIRRVPVCSDGSCSDLGGLLPRHGGLQGGGGAALHAPVGTRSFARHAPRERSECVSAGSPGASRRRAWLFRASSGDISRELRLKLDGVLGVMRDADGCYT